MAGLQTAVSKANYGQLKMLSKLQQMPLQVKLAMLVLLAVFVLILWAVPGAAIAIGLALATAYSLVIILDYFIRL